MQWLWFEEPLERNQHMRHCDKNLAGGSALIDNVIGSRRWLHSSPLDPGSLTFLMILSQEPITINILSFSQSVFCHIPLSKFCFAFLLFQVHGGHVFASQVVEDHCSRQLNITRLGEEFPWMWRIVITSRQRSGESTVSGFQSCMSVCSHRGKVPTIQDPCLSRGPQTDSNLFKLNLTVPLPNWTCSNFYTMQAHTVDKQTAGPQLKCLLVTECVQYLK